MVAAATVGSFHLCFLSQFSARRNQKNGGAPRAPSSPKSLLSSSNLPSALTVAEEKRRGDVNAEIKRFCQMGELREAMRLISGPTSTSSGLDSDVLCSLLQLCTESRSLADGRKLHSVIYGSGLSADTTLDSELVFMYAKCGDLVKGRKVFDEMTVKDRPFLWNILLSEYSKVGNFEESVHLFNLMRSSGVTPNSHTFSCILKCFGALRSIADGEKVHGYLLKLGFDGYNAVDNALISFYSKCNLIHTAVKLFVEMPEKDVISWNTIISGCVSNSIAKKGVELFIEMWFSGMAMDLATLISILPACGNIGIVKIGQAVHGYALKTGYVEEVILNNSLIDMYSKCWDIVSALQVFHKMNEKTVVSWTSAISTYTRAGQFNEAIALFEDMETSGIKPDLHAITTVLHACACSGLLDDGKNVHDYVLKNGLENNLFVVNALIDMYTKCGNMEAAKRVFDKTAKNDIISWNTMIGGYSQNNFPNDSLQLFCEMQSHVRPNAVTMACILPAVASLSALERGREIHGHVLRAGYLLDGYIENALVDMYAKSGALLLARILFDRIVQKDLFSWTVMIAGYGMHGHGKLAIAVFQEMRRQGVKPDEISFIAILYACSHSGLVDEGWRFFNSMRNEIGIEPILEHYACMVDLLSRAGQLTKAFKFIECMPIPPDSAVWGALLFGCRIHRDVKLAERVAEKVFELEPENTGYYVLMANLYAEAEKWESVKKMRKRIGSSRLQKNPGCSWVEMRNSVHIFVAGDKSHPQLRRIELFLLQVRRRMREDGYVPDKRYALLQGDDSKKEEALCGHSEKLAMAFAILNSSRGRPVRVTKNLRVCGDCHEVAKFISKMAEREIILRDSNRFHHFVEGRCSCRGYW